MTSNDITNDVLDNQNTDLSDKDISPVEVVTNDEKDVSNDTVEPNENEASAEEDESKSDKLYEGQIKLEVSISSVINYSLQQNGIPIIRKISVINETDKSFDTVELNITSSPALCHPLMKVIDYIPANSTIELNEVKPILDVEYISSLTEKQVGALSFSLSSDGNVLCTESVEITALAFDEWHGYSYYPELLAAFVTPNHPEVTKLSVRASDFLGQWTGSPSLDGYQTKDPNRVLSMAAAIYTAIQEQNILYAVPPASFNRVGQRVRLCDTVINQKLGTCLDLTLLFAACIEAAGLHPLLILKKGHIFAGFWLEELSFPEAVQDDATLVTKRLAEGVNEIAVVECTMFTTGKNASFDEAKDTAEKELAGKDPIEYIIDVKRARLSGITPLPLRILTDQGWQLDNADHFDEGEALPPKELGETINVDDLNDQESFPKQVQWERKLLDLGMRNQLINFKLSKNTLPIMMDSLEKLVLSLGDGTDYTVWSQPTELHLSRKDISFENLNDFSEYSQVIDSELQNQRIHSVCSEAETTRISKELYRSAKLSLEESGANTLYLALGILRWYETPRSTKARYAPIVLIPIDIIRKPAAKGYAIRQREEDPQINITLLEKIKQDFSVDINQLDPLPQNEKGIIDIRKILTVFRKAIMGQTRWDVLESSYIGIFSFSQFVMWNDIRNRSDDLCKNKIVRSLIDGKLSWEASSMSIGDEVSEDGVFLPLPTDASQLFAIKASCDGESFVLHGPPGTGKSQTITSLLANALAQGKTVLFVAEKMAALEVVQKRLQQIGIGDFCLELHSNKSKKKDVLEQLRKASEVTKSISAVEYSDQAARISTLRSQLDEYVSQLHKPQSCGMTLFEMIDHYERVADVSDISEFSVDFVKELSASDLQEQASIVDRLVSAGRLVGHPHGHPFHAIKLSQYYQHLRGELLELNREFYASLLELEKATDNLSDKLSVDISDYPSVAKLALIASELMLWLEFPREWAYFDDIDAYVNIQEMAKSYSSNRELRQNTDRLWAQIDLIKDYLQTQCDDCLKALSSLSDISASLAETLGIEAPVTKEEHTRITDIASELKLWAKYPKNWITVERPNVYFSDICTMAQHYISADAIKDKYSDIWRDSFWELDSGELLSEFREASEKWVVSKFFATSKLYKRLSTHAKSSLTKSEIGDYLYDLESYQTEIAKGDELFAKYRDDLDIYVSEAKMNWSKIHTDADRARRSMDRLTTELYAEDIFANHAGSTNSQKEIHKYLYVWESYLSIRNTVFASLHVDAEKITDDWLSSTANLFNTISEHKEEVALWLSWHDIATVALSRNILPEGSAPQTEVGEIDNSIPTLIRNHISNGSISSFDLFSKEVLLEQDNLVCFYGILTQYIKSHTFASDIFVQYSQEILPLTDGDDTDWEAIFNMAKTAERSATLLRSILGDDNVRKDFCADKELEPLLTAMRSAWKDMTDKQKAFNDLLQLEDEEFASDWFYDKKYLCQSIQMRIDDIKDWIAWNNVANEASESGLQNVVEAYRNGMSHVNVPKAYQKAINHALATYIIDNTPELNTFSGARFNEKIAQFKATDEEFTELTRREIFCRLASKVPNFEKEAARSSEVNILQRAIRSNGRGLSIRKLFEQIANLLPKLCPCMLMSPLSAAQYLDPKREPFDIVVFDEASQMPTCKAVGALARGVNAVIVGDPKQMPPTSFFSTNTLDEDNLDIEDLESILDDCLALNMPQTHLLWHYRSRHESLIAFSNSQFYENKLFTFPSVNDRESKVSLVQVDGVFERGKSRQNRAEATAIVDELKRRCHDEELSKFSVGVVTFNITQQALIDDMISAACASDPDFEAWVYQSEEPVFVKNLENVQGDERDVILFSIGYGLDENKKFSMNFGPLNRDGGWRRLNVAVSRARCEMMVFSSITPEQIDLSRSTSDGVAAFKAFLEYASGKKLAKKEDFAIIEKKRADCDGLIDSICSTLNKHGYETAKMVGQSEYRIDIAIVDPADPEKYLLGILLDGPNYKSAKNTRDREIAQANVLRQLGWKLIRVWSMDWWDNNSKEIERILTVLNDIQNGKDIDEYLGIEAVSEDTDADASIDSTYFEEKAFYSRPSQYVVTKYRAKKLPEGRIAPESFINRRIDGDVKVRINVVLQNEAPISEDLLAQRVLHSYGFTRLTAELVGIFKDICNNASLNTTLQDGMKFYWKQEQAPDSYDLIRVSDEGDLKRDVKDIPIQEAMNAICYVLNEQFSLSEVDLIREASKVFGYNHIGTNIEYLFKNAIAQAEKDSRIELSSNGSWILS